MNKYPKVKLKDIGIIVTGNHPKTDDINNYSSNDIMFIKPNDIQENFLTNIDKSEFYISKYAKKTARIVPKNTIFVTCIGIIGKYCISHYCEPYTVAV